MKIIHTSDWHLGQSFYGKSREQEQAAFLNWLVDQVAAQQADVLLVAGDLFDTGTPPSYARTLYNDFIVRLNREQPHCQLILLAGNHDSVAVLNESRGLLQALNTRVIAGADPEACDDSLPVYPLNDAQGEPGAVLCAIPFLRPGDLTRSRSERSADDRARELQQQISDYYRRLYEHARNTFPGLPVVMTGHLTTVGVQTSESVREIYIGTLEALPSSAFPPADYIALGHIHRSQKVGGQDHIRYCGAPMALGFDEVNRDKQLLVVELDRNGLQQVTELAVPVFQPMLRIQGDLTDIEARFDQLRTETDSDSAVIWAEIQVETDDYLPDLQPRITALAEGLPLEILRIRRSNRSSATLADTGNRVQLDELTPEEVFSRRLEQDETLSDERRAALTGCFREIAEGDPV